MSVWTLSRVKWAVFACLLATASPSAGAADPSLVGPQPEAPPAAPAPRTVSRRPPRWTDRFETGARVSLGLSRPSFAEAAASPTLIQWALAAGLGWRLGIGGFPLRAATLGILAEYRFVGHYSEIDPDVGNLKGTRFQPFSFTFGGWIGNFAKAQLEFQMAGPYKLSRPTVDGRDYAYTSPFGLRLVVTAPLRQWVGVSRLHAGVQLERVSYSHREISGLGEAELSEALTLWQFGTCVSYVF